MGAPKRRDVVFFPAGTATAVRHAGSLLTGRARRDAERTVGAAPTTFDTEQAEDEVPTVRKIPMGAHDPHPSQTGTVVFHAGEWEAFGPGANWLGSFATRAAAQRAIDMFLGRPVTAVSGSGFRLRPRVIGGRVADVHAFVGWLAEMARTVGGGGK